MTQNPPESGFERLKKIRPDRDNKEIDMREIDARAERQGFSARENEDFFRPERSLPVKTISFQLDAQEYNRFFSFKRETGRTSRTAFKKLMDMAGIDYVGAAVKNKKE